MRRLAYIITLLFLAVGCGQDDNRQSESVKLSVDKTSLQFAAAGGEQTFSVTSSELVRVSCDENWMKVSKGIKSKDHKTLVTVSVEKNPGNQSQLVKCIKYLKDLCYTPLYKQGEENQFHDA